MGQECQKLSSSLTFNPVLHSNGHQKNTQSTAPTSNNSDEDGTNSHAQLAGSLTGKEFLNPFGSNFLHRNHKVAWNWISTESAVKTSTEYHVLWAYLDELLDKVPYEEVQMLLVRWFLFLTFFHSTDSPLRCLSQRVFRRKVDEERNHQGLLLYRPVEVPLSDPTVAAANIGSGAINNKHTSTADTAVPDKDEDSQSMSVSMDDFIGNNPVDVKSIGHIWKRLSLMEHTLANAFPSLHRDMLSNIWIDICNNFLFNGLDQVANTDSEIEWQRLQQQKDTLRLLGLQYLHERTLLRMFFVIDILHTGTELIDCTQDKSAWNSIWKTLKRGKRKRTVAPRQIVFRDLCTLFAS
jgi:hypothetical protein